MKIADNDANIILSYYIVRRLFIGSQIQKQRHNTKMTIIGCIWKGRPAILRETNKRGTKMNTIKIIAYQGKENDFFKKNQIPLKISNTTKN